MTSAPESTGAAPLITVDNPAALAALVADAAGRGTALVALVGWAAFGQKLTLAGGAGIALIIVGVVVVQFNSTAH